MKANLFNGTEILDTREVADYTELEQLNAIAEKENHGAFWSFIPTRVEGFAISPSEPMTPNADGSPINPFLQDSFNMGQYLGRNIAIMFSNFENEDCPYLILINRKTGKKIRIIME